MLVSRITRNTTSPWKRRLGHLSESSTYVGTFLFKTAIYTPNRSARRSWSTYVQYMRRNMETVNEAAYRTSTATCNHGLYSSS